MFNTLKRLNKDLANNQCNFRPCKPFKTIFIDFECFSKKALTNEKYYDVLFWIKLRLKL